MYYWSAVSVKPEDHLVLHVKFADGLKGKVRFKPSHLNGVFKALKNESYFKEVYIDHGIVTQMKS